MNKILILFLSVILLSLFSIFLLNSINNHDIEIKNPENNKNYNNIKKQKKTVNNRPEKIKLSGGITSTLSDIQSNIINQLNKKNELKIKNENKKKNNKNNKNKKNKSNKKLETLDNNKNNNENNNKNNINKNNKKVKNNLINFKKDEISIFGFKCENGGIGFHDGCICPYGFKDEFCETPSKNISTCFDPSFKIEYLYKLDQVDPQTCKSKIGSLCCWSKFRSDNKISNSILNYKQLLLKTNNIQNYELNNSSKFSINNNDNHDLIIKSILQSYGPWDENDKLFLKYIIMNNIQKTNYILKYSNPVSQNFNYKLNINNNNYNNINNNKNKPSNNHQTQLPALSLIPSKSRAKLAFVLLIHDIDMPAIKLLFNHIYKVKHYYVIHVDANFKDRVKINQLKEYVKNLKNQNYKKDIFIPKKYPNNIEILQERFQNSWGSISLVYSELACYTKLVDMVLDRSMVTGVDEKWSHVINLSINDFPIKPIYKLEQFFSQKSNIQKNFINEDNILKESERYNKSWVECGKRQMVSINFGSVGLEDADADGDNYHLCGLDNGGVEKTINRKNYKEGSQWHFITFKFAHYLISDFRSISRLFSMKFSFIPDESFFQIAKSESKDLLIDQDWDIDNYRFIPWYNSDKALIVGMDEIKSNFNNNSRYFFTRKVYTSDIKNEIIEKYLKD
ncbi:GlcNAc transferase [Dictyostelium discoideum AX4]|uniref:protein xylosyltransferase n=1 Tax=Dictyostelium discoideum TaxID=44689 RepID=Q55CU3_DICDI|nr:GlcNAc transferase [Dictyostelium discoideum AX4]EAL72300.1 GlcNAc transferase [Dictyostelium discoideum AX4]|eukprot:XP_646388.1 GlcNAc transferase [Dictyostelium discoideum AX4]